MPKDLLGIPWRVAFALQKSGWYLWNDIIWHKPNAQPENVSDRCVRDHEYLFMLGHPESGGSYFFNTEAIRRPTRLERTVWPINTEPFAGAHCAPWPSVCREPFWQVVLLGALY